MSSVQPLVDAADRRRSPATMPAFRAGKAPRNKGQRYPADPPPVDEIVAVMRAAGQARYGARLNGLIVVLWRAGLRIHEALSLLESDLDTRRGSILVTHGKNHRRREVGMDAWAWSALEPWLAERAKLPVGPLVLRDRRPDSRPSLVRIRGSARTAPDRDPGRCAPTLRASPVEACSRSRATARRHPTPADPAPAGAFPSIHHGHVPAGDLLRGDHLDCPRSASSDDARQRRAGALTAAAGAHDALPRPSAAAVRRALSLSARASTNARRSFSSKAL